jgi:surface-adhesin protein E
MRKILASTAFGGVLLVVTQLCYATHWQTVGTSKGDVSGMVYMDMDSVRQEHGYRVALFLTIYGHAASTSHDNKVDRITQETAFNCDRREFALLATEGYFQGKKVGGSAYRGSGDWAERFKLVPKDPFSQAALDLACNAPLAPQPEPTPLPAEMPGSVSLPGPSGVITGTVPAPSAH